MYENSGFWILWGAWKDLEARFPRGEDKRYTALLKPCTVPELLTMLLR